MANFQTVTLITLNIFQLPFSLDFHRHMFDESWLRNLTANLHKESVQRLCTQISEEELDNDLKESQTSNKSSDPDGIYPLKLRHIGTLFKDACLKLFNLCITQEDTFGFWEMSFFSENLTKKTKKSQIATDQLHSLPTQESCLNA